MRGEEERAKGLEASGSLKIGASAGGRSAPRNGGRTSDSRSCSSDRKNAGLEEGTRILNSSPAALARGRKEVSGKPEVRMSPPE